MQRTLKNLSAQYMQRTQKNLRTSPSKQEIISILHLNSIKESGRTYKALLNSNTLQNL